MPAVVMHLCSSYARRLPPKEALHFLLDLDNSLYVLHGEMAVAYGNGLHTKHRHTRYHDFFTGRIHAGERVLDIGCGNGAVAHEVAVKSAARVVAFDLEPLNIEKAMRDFPHQNISYHVGDALHEIPESGFDVVILSNVLEHLPDRSDFLRGVREKVNPSRFLIRVPLFDRDWRVPLKRELGVECRLDATHETEYTVESFTSELQDAGLTISHIEVHWGEIWSEACKAP